jgi:hypothetical protein
MKKVKLMLLSLSVLAVVGGALAFTAKTGSKFCVVPTTSSSLCPANCPNYISITDPIKSTDFVCTTITTGTLGSECTLSSGAPKPCGLVTPQHKTME